MTDEIEKNPTTRPTSAEGDKAKAKKVSSAEFRGVSRKNGAAVFEVTYSDGTVKRKESPKDEMLPALKQIIENPKLLNNKNMFINGSNFARIVNAYKKAGHLGDELIRLFSEKEDALRNRLRALAAPPTTKKSGENPGRTSIGMDVATETKTETPTQTSEIKVLDYSSKRSEEAEREVKAIFTDNSEGYDKVRAFNDLLPNIRYVLNKPNLNLADLKQLYSNTKGTTQQAYNKLRDALQTAVSKKLQNQKGTTDPLTTFFKSDQGQDVLKKPGEIFMITIAHLFAQSRKEHVKAEHITGAVKIYLATAKALAEEIRAKKS